MTVLQTTNGMMEWVIMPFGLCNAQGKFPQKVCVTHSARLFTQVCYCLPRRRMFLQSHA
jgi:hypothetical protein